MPKAKQEELLPSMSRCKCDYISKQRPKAVRSEGDKLLGMQCGVCGFFEPLDPKAPRKPGKREEQETKLFLPEWFAHNPPSTPSKGMH